MAEMNPITPTTELACCQERSRKLAMEKSYLQLVNHLMLRLGEETGVEGVVDTILRLLLDNLGGSNVAIYYRVDGDLCYADVYGQRRTNDRIADEIVQRCFVSQEFVEVDHDFAQTRMLTPAFTRASTWAAPLLVGTELVGVLKLTDMLMAAMEIRQQLEPFFRYCALVLRNEISGYAKLNRAYAELRETNARLSAEIRQREQAESSLRITQFAVDHASDSLFWITPEARFANVNDSACRSLGYSRDELLQLTVFDVDPAFPTEAWAAHWQEIKERGSFTIETKHRTKEGRVFPVEVMVNFVEYQGAEYNFAFARDITDRRRADDTLRGTKEALEQAVAQRTLQLVTAMEQLRLEMEERRLVEERLQITQFAVDTAADAIFWVRPDGAYAYANKAACDLLGYPWPELSRLKTFDFNPDHQGPAWLAHWQLLKEQGSLRFETVLRTKDGSWVPVEITANYVEFHQQEYNCAFVRDISARLRAEEESRRSAREWSAAMDASEDAIYLLDVDRRLLRANKAFYRMTQSTPESAVGRSVVGLMHPGGAKIPCQLCQAQVEQREIVVTMEPDHPHNPAGHPFEIVLKMVRDDAGKPISMLMTWHDLSHERTVQAELTAYRENLEELVRTRTAEIEKKKAEVERLNRLFVGRELRMIELKQLIRELTEQLGGAEEAPRR